MTRRATLTLATAALVTFGGTAGAQRASLAVGAAMPVGDIANTAGTGFDIELQIRTEPMFGPLPLRIDAGYEMLSGKGTSRSTTIEAGSISLMDDFGLFYWAAGPGYYQSTTTITVAGHNGAEVQPYLGAQVAVGMNIKVFRWDGFLEIAGVRFFSSRPTPMYVPLRFGVRL